MASKKTYDVPGLLLTLTANIELFSSKGTIIPKHGCQIRYDALGLEFNSDSVTSMTLETP